MVASHGSSNKVKKNSFSCVQKGNKTCVIKTKHRGKPKKQVIPVIYIPGVFASRLEQPNGDKIWDPDDESFMTENLAKSPGLGTILFDTGTQSKSLWTDDEIEKKIHFLSMKWAGQPMNKSGTPVRDQKEQEKLTQEIISDSEQFKQILNRKKIDPSKYDYPGMGVFRTPRSRKKNELNKHIKELAVELYQVRRERGWYGVMGEYITIMEKISLHDHDEFLYPTFGFGYDWRQDIKDSATKFKTQIDKILAIKEYPEYGELGKDYEIEPSNKVIIVTHSMGSIVTRYCSEFSGAKDNIHGVLHLNQPTTGAPVLYRRFLMGTEYEKKSVFFNFFSLKQTIKDNIFNEILGVTPYHFTKLVGTMPGPLELLPTNQHRLDDSLINNPTDIIQKNNWLNITHNFLKPIATQNSLCVYDDIYKSDKIGLLSCKRYDEKGQQKPYTKEEFKMAKTLDDEGFADEKLKSELTSSDLRMFDVVEYEPKTSPYIDDSYRLISSSEFDLEKSTETSDFKVNVHKAIDLAKKFHDELKLEKHKKTFVGCSTGIPTVLNIIINLENYNDRYRSYDMTKQGNKDLVMNLPLNTETDGDGTVPLTSLNALYAANSPIKAEPSGDIITGDKSGHAEIPLNSTALKQVTIFLDEVTKGLINKNATASN